MNQFICGDIWTALQSSTKKRPRRGALAVYRVPNLHAKVFVIGRTAWVGSANVSRHSARHLIEAMLGTSERGAVDAALRFVGKLCRQQVGPEELTRLEKIWRPPRFSLGSWRAASAHLTPVRIVQLQRIEPPEWTAEMEAAGRKAAKKRMSQSRQMVLDHFHIRGKCALNERDRVLEVINEGGSRRLVEPTATVVHK